MAFGMAQQRVEIVAADVETGVHVGECRVDITIVQSNRRWRRGRGAAAVRDATTWRNSSATNTSATELIPTGVSAKP